MSMRNIYRKIAKENGTTPDEVKREIQLALNEAYKNRSQDRVVKANQGCVPCKGEVPTTDEFINYAITKIKKHRGE